MFVVASIKPSWLVEGGSHYKSGIDRGNAHLTLCLAGTSLQIGLRMNMTRSMCCLARYSPLTYLNSRALLERALSRNPSRVDGLSSDRWLAGRQRIGPLSLQTIRLDPATCSMEALGDEAGLVVSWWS